MTNESVVINDANILFDLMSVGFLYSVYKELSQLAINTLCDAGFTHAFLLLLD